MFCCASKSRFSNKLLPPDLVSMVRIVYQARTVGDRPVQTLTCEPSYELLQPSPDKLGFCQQSGISRIIIQKYIFLFYTLQPFDKNFDFYFPRTS